MSRFSAGRYIVAETAISVAINTALNVAPAALAANGQETLFIPGASGLAFDAVLPLFMGALMSALVPSLLTRRRQLAGKLQAPLGRDGPSIIHVALLSLLLAALSAALGMLLAGTVMPLMAGRSVTLGAMLLFKGVYGGLLAASVTPLALLLLFGRGWGNAMDKTSVLVIGLEPSLIDFSEEGYSAHPGLDAEVVRAALGRSEASLIALGFDARLCMVDFGETAAPVVKAHLEQTRFDCVVIGAGLRLNARNTALFETMINVVHEDAPQAKLCFNTRAADTAEAVQRWFPAR